MLLGAALLLASFNLRPAVTSLGPVLPEVIRGAHLTAAEASALATLPALCFGLFAPVAPPLARRIGMERTVLAMLVILAAGTALRVFETGWSLFAGAVLAGGAIGVVNVLLPGLVKRDFADRVALMTGLYTMTLSIGAAGAAGVTVPLARAFGSWGASLAIWAVPALLAAAVMVPTIPPEFHAPVRRGRGGLWRSGLAWQVTLLMGFQSAVTYCTFDWLAPILRDRGLSPVEAGLALSLSVLVQVGSTLGGAPFAQLFRDQRLPTALSLVVGTVGFLGCLYAPLSWIWGSAVVMGLGEGAVFPMALMIIVLRAPDTATAARLSGMAQAVGYVIAAAAPFVVGLTHQWMGDWRATGPLIVVYAAIGIAAGLGAGRLVMLERS